ncbi:hypothetical protein [Phormidium sp. CCY1219]|uniref:hypothetical protein n=1 Tax=Phormidium sp. CCY1219 TaxID=2886104 RepID=UPI002D1E519D|nr:hypothetical protein [Phormidium sp. CCY1219]MEB3829443.1 YbjN domain-containing protein [Phormidium sp. CCY1219]
MATSLAQIAQYLDNVQWRYQIDRSQSRIHTRVKAQHVERFCITIELLEEGKFFQIYAPRLLSGVAQHPHRELIFRTLLSLSWRTKMLKWEYDAIDGEVRASIELPLEDAPLTQAQFSRILSGFVQLVDRVAMPRIQAVMATGTDPYDLEIGEKLLLFVQERAPQGSLRALESALMRRKQEKLPST